MLPQPLQQVDRTFVRCGAGKLVYFGGCDYFRLASHPKVLEALREAVGRYGLNVAASRITTGNHQLYGRFEAELADFFGAEASLLLPNGYSTGMAVAQACAGCFTVAWLDEKAHASLRDAARFLGCPVRSFPHRAPDELAKKLRRTGGSGKAILLTDGIFSHSGAVAPLAAYRQILPSQAIILVDDAHAAGVLGQTGQGTIQHESLPRQGFIQTVTLSKAFGVGGGAVLGPASLREQMIKRSGLFAGSTPLPLPLVAAAREALKLLRPRNLRVRLTRNVAWVRNSLREAGLAVADTPSPILSFQPKVGRDGSTVSRALASAGIHPPWICYAGGPAAGYFRFALSSEHSAQQLENLVAVLAKCGNRLVPVE